LELPLPNAAIKLDDIEEGATYVLLGGLQEAVRRNRTHTQASDRALEEAATAAMLEDATQYGVLEKFTSYDYEGTKQVLRLGGDKKV